ncbi:MAG: hypothetical protein J0L57_17975, partial [Burkholderiales bacterium]|nr:hypothetical protein [Burkholderiales bacterium]
MSGASGPPDWEVGDRFWTPWYGIGTIVSLRRSPRTPIPHAQARLVPDPGISIWVYLEGAVKLSPDEPARPSEGLQSTTVGQGVWHRDWGYGTVYEVKPLGDGRQAARIAFDHNEGMLRWIVLGGGALRDKEPSLKPLPPPQPPLAQPPKPHKRVWLLDDTFEPKPLRLPVLDENERDAWIKTVAARRASHLRAVAGRLQARGEGAAPMRFELLAPLFRGEGLTPVTLPPQLRAVDAAWHAAAPGALRFKRLAPHATRWLHALGDGTVWVSAAFECDFARDFYRLRSWAASAPDHRFRLGPRGAPALLEYAAQTERAHGLEPQPPLWLAKPTGWLHGESLALVQRLFAGAEHDLVEHVWQQRDAVALDLRSPVEPQLPGAPAAAVQAA